MKKLIFILLVLSSCATTKHVTKYDNFIHHIDSNDYPTHVREFFHSEVVNSIRVIAPIHEVKPSIAVAQAILETGWGRYTHGNSYFGIKASGGYDSIDFTTHEYINGVRVDMVDSFRDYVSPYESVWDYCLFVASSRYGMSECDNYTQAVHQLVQPDYAYATAPDYIERLCQLIEKYELWRLD